MDYSDSLIFAAPTARERQIALSIGIGALVAVILMTPFGHIPAGPSSPIVTLVYTAYVAAASLTAWLLRHQFRSSGYVPLALLGIAHGYGALLIAPYLLTFPHVFAPGGLLGAGPQTAAWLWVLAHAGFICLAFLYVAAEHFYGRSHNRPGAAEFIRASAAAALVGATTIIAVTTVHSDRLPILVLNDVTFTPLFTHRIVPLLIFAYAIIFALVVVLTRLRTVTNLWVAVVLVSLTGELTAGGLISGSRFTWGWYLGCAEGAVAALTFLVVMLRQMNDVLVDFAISNRTLAEKSVRDHLTELLNRRGFDDRIAEVFRHMRRRSTAVALLMVDIDHFKAYNDQFGHIRGDDALRAIGNTIASAANRAHDS